MRSHDSAIYALGRAVAISRPNQWERARGAAPAGQTNAPLVDAGANRQRHAISAQIAAAGGAATRKVPKRYGASVVWNFLCHWFPSFHGTTFCVENFRAVSSHSAHAANAAVRTQQSDVWSVVSHYCCLICGAIGRRYRNVLYLFVHAQC